MSSGPPSGFRWRIEGPPGPPLTMALVMGEAVRAAVYRGAEAAGLMPLPDSFHRSDDHSHAHWLSEDADGDGLADHVTLHALAGLPARLLPVLAGGLEVALSLPGGGRLPVRGTWRLAPAWLGQLGPWRLFGPARRWASHVPFVTPDWCTRTGRADDVPRAGRDLVAQLHRELVRHHDYLGPSRSRQQQYRVHPLPVGNYLFDYSF